MIEVVNLNKAYEGVRVLSQLSFTANDNEILGVIGPNGAGKTTTMRCITGIHPPTSGLIRISGYDVQEDEMAAKAELGFVGDTPLLFDRLTVLEHLIFAQKTFDAEDDDRIDELMDRFELMDIEDAIAQDLSRGTRQKVALAMALVHSPTALVLDEPMVGLDPAGMQELRDILAEEAEAGTAVLLSSHQLDEVERLCQRFLIIHEGQRQAYGTLDEINAQLAGDVDSLEAAFFTATSMSERRRR